MVLCALGDDRKLYQMGGKQTLLSRKSIKVKQEVKMEVL